MQNRRRTPRLALALTLLALLLPAGALAAPTGSQITAPADPTFVTIDQANVGSLHVEGTTTGGTGDVDIRCYHGDTSDLIAGPVPVANGAFATDVALTKPLYDSLTYPKPYCVLRAVPAATFPAAAPDQASPFQGPHVAWGRTDPITLGPIGAPNPADQLFDFAINHAQSRGYNDYDSAGSCGLCDSYLFDPVTFKGSNPIWYENAALFANIPNTPKTRSAVRVDGIDVYNPTSAGWANNALKNNPGYPALSFSSSVDPLTGDLTIHETDPFVACTQQPATYPPSDATCAAFAPPVITLDRSIVQDHDGRQVTITDRFKSNDAQAHSLDAVYDDTNENYAAIPGTGHDSLYDFSWTGDGFTTYDDGTQIVPPSTAPATLFVKSDQTTPDAGDSKNPIGALTYGTPPSEITVRHNANHTNNTGEWQERYLRTVPATGDLVITHVYSQDYSLASVEALAQAAAIPAPVTDTAQDPPALVSGGDPLPTSTGSSSATRLPVFTPPAKCKVPKLRGRTVRSAKRLLVKAHCRIGKLTRKASSRVRPRRVIASKPRAGSLRTRGARIALTVATR
jgi:hypothetical protein